MRKRSLNGEMAWWEEFGNLPIFIQLVFDRLMLHADDWGKVDGSPERIKARMFPCAEEMTVEMIETAIMRLSSTPYTDNRALMSSYDAQGIKVCVFNPVLYERWNHVKTRDKSASEYPDDPKYAMRIEVEKPTANGYVSTVGTIANVQRTTADLCDYWNKVLGRSPRASWTSTPLQSIVTLLLTPKNALYNNKRGRGWTPQHIERVMFNLNEISLNELSKTYYRRMPMEEFLEKEAEYFQTMDMAADRAIMRNLTPAEKKYRSLVKELNT